MVSLKSDLRTSDLETMNLELNTSQTRNTTISFTFLIKNVSNGTYVNRARPSYKWKGTRKYDDSPNIKL